MAFIYLTSSRISNCSSFNTLYTLYLKYTETAFINPQFIDFYGILLQELFVQFDTAFVSILWLDLDVVSIDVAFALHQRRGPALWFELGFD